MAFEAATARLEVITIAAQPRDSLDQWLTVPNVISVLRILMVPVFAWLIFTEHDGLALTVLVVSSFSDWLDGWIARRWNQASDLGRLLDPAADRLYIITTLLGLAFRDFIPWWLVIVIVAREVVLAPTILVLARRGYAPLPVHFIGKAGTFLLLYAFPLLLLGSWNNPVGEVASIIGWALALWGTGLYWLSAMLYLRQFFSIMRQPQVNEAL